MCGYGPAVVMLTAARKLGATKAELIRYATSGDVSGRSRHGRGIRRNRGVLNSS